MRERLLLASIASRSLQTSHWAHRFAATPAIATQRDTRRLATAKASGGRGAGPPQAADARDRDAGKVGTEVEVHRQRRTAADPLVGRGELEVAQRASQDGRLAAACGAAPRVNP